MTCRPDNIELYDKICSLKRHYRRHDRQAFLKVLSSLPVEIYSGTMFSYQSGDSLLFMTNPSVAEEGGRLVLRWESRGNTSSKRTRRISAVSSPLYLESARNIIGEAEGAFLALEKAGNEQSEAERKMRLLEDYEKMTKDWRK